VGLPVAAYSQNDYSAIVYGRGLFFFEELAKTLGADVLEKHLSQYFERYAWQFVTKEDLESLLEEACSCELDRAFNAWISPKP
jgi:aminopeptidase N